jgi:flavin-dependent dehydrogenase
METLDALIVGGGPAGSSCAWKLRRSGLNVAVLDKASFPRHKVCGGWITLPIVDDLELDLSDYGNGRTLQPITRFRTGMIGGAEIATDYQAPVSYGIRRCEFDDYLLRRSDARLMLGQPFWSMNRDGDDWIVNETLRTPVVIGAGGHFCPVARRAESKPIEPSSTPVVLAQEVEFEMSADQQAQCTVLADQPELYFCPDLKGYGWVFRKGNYLNIGLGREGEDHLSAHVAGFVTFLQSRGKVCFPLPMRFQGHAYRLRTEVPCGSREPGVLLVGDAIGLAERQSGEGIRPAIESGLMCAESLLAAWQTRREQAGDIYQAKLNQRFRESPLSVVTGWLPKSLRRLAAHRLLSSSWFTRRVILDRWFLHRTA